MTVGSDVIIRLSSPKELCIFSFHCVTACTRMRQAGHNTAQEIEII
jgi:hypothetical protein